MGRSARGLAVMAAAIREFADTDRVLPSADEMDRVEDDDAIAA
jgi:hypothetical protein